MSSFRKIIYSSLFFITACGFSPLYNGNEPSLLTGKISIQEPTSENEFVFYSRLVDRFGQAGDKYILNYTIATAKEESAEVLAHGLLQAYELLDTTPIDQRVAVLDRLMIRVAIGASYFVEIAKLRALSILWANLAKAYGLEQGLPDLEVVLAEASHDKNENTNMIRSTTQAMSAIIGGANRLIVRSASKECNTFTRRIARNVQHLLKMESYLDRVVDPAAGSYYIEALTTQLAQKAWDIFQSKL